MRAGDVWAGHGRARLQSVVVVPRVRWRVTTPCPGYKNVDSWHDDVGLEELKDNGIRTPRREAFHLVRSVLADDSVAREAEGSHWITKCCHIVFELLIDTEAQN